jgi:iron complex transport system substrate-binding protein
MLVALGRLLGDEGAGQRVAHQIRTQVADVAKAIVKRSRPRALVVFGLRPIVVAGPGSFPDEMLRLAGGENVVRGERNRFPTLGIERVLALDPDVIVDTTGVAMREEVSVSRDLPGWSEVRAARDNHVIRVSDDRVLRPGPRVGEGLVVLAKALHPGVDLP